MLGVSTGGYISDLPSLQIGEVFQSRHLVMYLFFDKSIVKDQETSRTMPVNVKEIPLPGKGDF